MGRPRGIDDWYPGEGRIGEIRGTADDRPIAAPTVPARRALLEYPPIRPGPDGRIYRSLRLGRLAGVFVPLWVPTGRNHRFVAGDPMRPLYQVRDGWAAGPRLSTDTDGNHENPLGFESELRATLADVRTAGVRDVVWLATDVHHARGSSVTSRVGSSSTSSWPARPARSR